MKLKITVEVVEEDETIAEGRVTGELDITKGNGMHSTEPILTVKMQNIYAAVEQTIFQDSNA